MAMRIPWFTILTMALAFGAGIYAWKVNNTGLVVVPPQQAAPKPVEQAVLVTIDGEPVTAAEIQWEYRAHTRGVVDGPDLQLQPDLGDRLEVELAPLRKSLLSQIVERRVMFQYAKRDPDFSVTSHPRRADCEAEFEALKSDPDNTVAGWSDRDHEFLRRRLCERALVEVYLAEQAAADINITDDAIADYYKAHPEEFKEPAKVKIRHILVADEGKAKRVRARLRKHNFASWAREVSISPEAEDGGSLPAYAKGDLPRVFDIAFRMRRGEVSNILKSPYGFHFILVQRKSKARQLSLAEASDQIRGQLLDLAQQEHYNGLLDRALRVVKVAIPSDATKSL